MVEAPGAWMSTVLFAGESYALALSPISRASSLFLLFLFSSSPSSSFPPLLFSRASPRASPVAHLSPNLTPLFIYLRPVDCLSVSPIQSPRPPLSSPLSALLSPLHSCVLSIIPHQFPHSPHPRHLRHSRLLSALLHHPPLHD